ncbi:hypothetical protein NE237_002858 [Protea cynaroides]|uniref:Uncharacterized protein n=1 Tax=Protea cynaroides TaxID=273540 RepID=A0A9Q0KGB6_9MAGN|nr:hypothetical protein NE237_002858 [Protea cynaroides]
MERDFRCPGKELVFNFPTSVGLWRCCFLCNFSSSHSIPLHYSLSKGKIDRSDWVRKGLSPRRESSLVYGDNIASLYLSATSCLNVKIVLRTSNKGDLLDASRNNYICVAVLWGRNC